MTKTSEATSQTGLRWHRLLFGVQRSVRYHARRRQFYDRLDKGSNILAAVAGSATVVSAVSAISHVWTVVLATLVAIFSAISIVVGPSQAARLHSDLARRFIELECEMQKCEHPDDEDVNNYIAERLVIEMDEPPIMQVLNSICHNELCLALGYGDRYSAKVNWFQAMCAQLFDVLPSHVRPSGAYPADADAKKADRS